MRRVLLIGLFLLIGAFVAAERYPAIHERVPWLPALSAIPIVSSIPGIAPKPAADPETSADSTTTKTHGSKRGGRFAGEGPVPVLTAPAHYADVPVTQEVLGTVQATNSVTVRSQVDGKLIEVAFKEGQEVRKGDVLARIDPAIYKAQYDQVVAKKAQDESMLANAQVDLVRYQKLAESQYGSHQQADTQRALVAQYAAQIAQDQASIDTAKTTLDYATIRAPIDGRTGLRQVDQGNIVHASDTSGIVNIAQVRPIAVVFNLPQQWLRQVNAAAAKGALKLEAHDGDSAAVLDTGALEVVDNTVDQATGTIKLKGSFPNDAAQLWPGLFVNVRLYVDVLSHVVVVPTPAVQRGPDGTFVYVVEGGAVVQTKVTVGRQTEADSVVTAGLAPPAEVVTTGFNRLTDGAKVAVATADASGNTAKDAAAPQDGSASAPNERHRHKAQGAAAEAQSQRKATD